MSPRACRICLEPAVNVTGWDASSAVQQAILDAVGIAWPEIDGERE